MEMEIPRFLRGLRMDSGKPVGKEELLLRFKP
jgi:hypothetical protein